jgi:hypothetical protein
MELIHYHLGSRYLPRFRDAARARKFAIHVDETGGRKKGKLLHVEYMCHSLQHPLLILIISSTLEISIIM